MLTRENAGEAAGWNTSDAIRRYVDDLTRLLAALDTEAIVKFADILFSAYQEGRTVFFAGNGGSAATASHFACDMAKTVTGYSKGKRLRAVSLADSVPLLTAGATTARTTTSLPNSCATSLVPATAWSPSAAAANPKTWSTLSSWPARWV